ncbi:MAG TPA: molybdenum cofactor guanylyltransferase [Candidatus Baltobacteraceae bacterium]
MPLTAQDSGDLGVLLLAGGEATRLPGKLLLDAGGVPLLVRAYRNVAATYPVWISCDSDVAHAIAGWIDAPTVADRWPQRGPLCGILSTMSEMTTSWVFVLAGDLPFVDARVIARLACHIDQTTEAVVPTHIVDEQLTLEPLVALYAREAFLREGLPLIARGHGSPRPVIDCLQTTYVDLADEHIFINVNTPEDYTLLRDALQ